MLFPLSATNYLSCKHPNLYLIQLSLPRNRTPLSKEQLNALLTTPIKIEQKHQPRYYVKLSSNKGRIEGTSNYSQNDIDLLLNLIEEIKPAVAEGGRTI